MSLGSGGMRREEEKAEKAEILCFCTEAEKKQDEVAARVW